MNLVCSWAQAWGKRTGTEVCSGLWRTTLTQQNWRKMFRTRTTFLCTLGSCGCAGPNQAGTDSEQCVLSVDVPVHSKGIGLDDL